MRAAAIDIPMEQGTFVNLNDAKADGSFTISGNGSIEKDDAYAVGNTGKNKQTTLTFKFNNKAAGDYILGFRTGTKKDPVDINVSVSGNGYTASQDFEVPNVNTWDRVTQRYMLLENLPEGEVTMALKVKENVSDYAGNYGNFCIYSVNSYDNISAIDLQKGIYTTARYEEKNQNIGYIQNGATASYSAYNSYSGNATLNMGLTFYNAGVMTVTVVDALTGKEEVNKDFNITKDICHGYDKPTSFELGELTKGLKNISFKFTIESGYICNYKNLGVTISNDVTVGSTGFATIGFPYTVTLPEDMKAYAITSVKDNTVTLTEVQGSVAANTGLIVSAAPGTYSFATATEGDEVADNKLVANVYGTKTAESTADFYVLGIVSADDKTVGMMPIAAGGTVGQYKAYLPASEVSATAAAKGLKIVIAGQPTAVKGVQAEEPANNSNAAIYNLAGQRVNAAAKGIYIINGHKYIK